MIELCVTLETGVYYPMFVFVPTGNEVLRRLSLKREWNYIMVGKHKDQKDPFVINGNTVIKNGTSIRLYKKSIEPICTFERLTDIVDRLKMYYRYNHTTKHFLVWMNYNLFYNPAEPIYLIFIVKTDGNWEESVKTTDSFKELEEAMISGDVFDTLSIVNDRFQELYEYYTW